MREFNTAVAELQEEGSDLEYPYEIKIDGVVCYYRKPEDGEYSVLLASIGRFKSLGEKVGAAVDLFAEVYDQESQEYLIGRLMDPRDRAFGFPQVADLLEVMVEEWTGRPTQASSGSTPRRRKTGSGS